MDSKEITYSSILKSIATLKNCGTLYEFKKGSTGELVESSSSGSKYSFEMNLLGYKIGIYHDIRSIKLPRKKRKKLLVMLKRRVRNLKKEIARMEFTDEEK
jgi:hypothetical protein